MISLILLWCTNASQVECRQQTINLPASITIDQCTTAAHNMLADKTGMIMPLAPFRDAYCIKR